MNDAPKTQLPRMFTSFAKAQHDERARHLASFFVEEAIGWHPTPLGLVQGFMVNGKSYTVPMATEEASVIAAARFVGVLASRFGGVHTTQMKTITKAQVFVRSNCSYDSFDTLAQNYARESDEAFPQMKQRGGGLQGLRVQEIDIPSAIDRFKKNYSTSYVVTLSIDCLDSMGAHRCTEMADYIGSCFERDDKGEKLAAIVSNDGAERVVTARMTLPMSLLRRITGKKDAVSRLQTMFLWANEDPARAVTHNKGIMNGVTALLLASCNDTRANEAAVHAYACRSGSYKPLSRCHVEGDTLSIVLELPLVLGSVGLAIHSQPGAALFFRLLSNNGEHNIDAPCLASIAAGIGLAQNLAALAALIGDGLQKGHMTLHNKRMVIRQMLDTRTDNPQQ